MSSHDYIYTFTYSDCSKRVVEWSAQNDLHAMLAISTILLSPKQGVREKNITNITCLNHENKLIFSTETYFNE